MKGRKTNDEKLIAQTKTTKHTHTHMRKKERMNEEQKADNNENSNLNQTLGTWNKQYTHNTILECATLREHTNHIIIR